MDNKNQNNDNSSSWGSYIFEGLKYAYYAGKEFSKEIVKDFDGYMRRLGEDGYDDGIDFYGNVPHSDQINIADQLLESVLQSRRKEVERLRKEVEELERKTKLEEEEMKRKLEEEEKKRLEEEEKRKIEEEKKRKIEEEIKNRTIFETLFYDCYSGWKYAMNKVTSQFSGLSIEESDKLDFNEKLKNIGLGIYTSASQSLVKIQETVQNLGSMIKNIFSSIINYTSTLIKRAIEFVKNNIWIALGIAAILLATTFYFKDYIYSKIFKDEKIELQDYKLQNVNYNILANLDKTKLDSDKIVFVFADENKKNFAVQHCLVNIGAFSPVTVDIFKNLINYAQKKNEIEDFTKNIQKIIVIYDEEKYLNEMSGNQLFNVKDNKELHVKMIKEFIKKHDLQEYLEKFNNQKISYISYINIFPIITSTAYVLKKNLVENV